MLRDVTKGTVSNTACIVWLTNNSYTGKLQGNYALGEHKIFIRKARALGNMSCGGCLITFTGDL